jgi:pimeloyl-ACP methyl ester carboxylesterase
MSSYVLVPGAWLGSWAWKDVAGMLWSMGHEAHPLTLTGLSDRLHVASSDIDLETHIRDVQNFIGFNELSDVVLVGHSYGGAVIRGVADRMASQIAQLVYIDTVPRRNGEAFIDLYRPAMAAAMRDGVERQGDGWKLPHPTAATLGNIASTDGLSEVQLFRFEKLATDQPFATYTQPLRLTGTSESFYSRTLIQCNDCRRERELDDVTTGEPVDRLSGEWRVLDLETGHWPMLSDPKALATLLDQLVR